MIVRRVELWHSRRAVAVDWRRGRWRFIELILDVGLSIRIAILAFPSWRHVVPPLPNLLILIIHVWYWLWVIGMQL